MKSNDKQFTGAVGESLVITELLKRGWTAANANTVIRNNKSIDIICIKCDDNTWHHQSALIQVKARYGRDFPSGFSLRDSIDLEELNKKVKGPYVFVYFDEENNPDYYILSRSQFIKLLYEIHDRYCNKIQRKKNLNMSLPAEINLNQLQGKDGRNNNGIERFKNPFPGNIFHNAWNNIWED